MEDVCIDPQRNRLFRDGLNHGRLIPEIVWQIRELFRRRGLKLTLRHTAQSRQIGSTAQSLATLT